VFCWVGSVGMVFVASVTSACWEAGSGNSQRVDVVPYQVKIMHMPGGGLMETVS
jgi:hypothetical protein